MIGHINKYLSHSPIIGDVIISEYWSTQSFKYEVRELFNDGNDIRPVVTLCLSYDDDLINVEHCEC